MGYSFEVLGSIDLFVRISTIIKGLLDAPITLEPLAALAKRVCKAIPTCLAQDSFCPSSKSPAVVQAERVLAAPQASVLEPPLGALSGLERAWQMAPGAK